MSCTNAKARVWYAALGEADLDMPIYPAERNLEILGCKNEKVKREKYYVWQLLRLAVKEMFDLEFDNLQFTKLANGQWVCPDFYFSLSHSSGAVAVAISDLPIGVDIEATRHVEADMAERFLTDKERECFTALTGSEAESFFLEAWTKKESVFKKTGGNMLMPRAMESSRIDAYVEKIRIFGKEYILAVSSEYEKEKTVIRFTEEI